MSWFLALMFFVVGIGFWRASHRADQLLVAWLRWILAVSLIVVSALLLVVQC